ncbi:MAG TPA: hypothetical protein EYP33_08030 [Pyrodictium sp.]|uniref:Uncharacterized protein n=1 Tax=Pyrodictium delaneyi TaxID=1273541 RepID=A0A832ZUJ7_9CREN|nr:hypothetical protein [Pyrodictium sp.]HIQ24064.1 hypothetical protein [Pyrodictium delaneyi]
MSVVRAEAEGGRAPSWLEEHMWRRLRALFDLVLQLSVLRRRRDLGEWLAVWLTYLGLVGAILTAIITAATRGVVLAANTVLRPHALPIISPALEKLFISWPQLAIGIGYHAHIITALYFAAPAYTAALVAAFLLKDEWLRGFLFPRGINARDVSDHLLLVLSFLTAWAAAVIAPRMAAEGALVPGLQALAPHIAIGTFWIIYSLAIRGLAYRVVGTALMLLYVVVFNRYPERVFRDILEEDPWGSLLR